MARSTFGGFGGDQVSLDPAGNSGFYKAAANYTTGTFWSASTGGTQYTDLVDPITSVALAGVSTDAHGHVVPFKGPDGVTEGWLDFGGGRFKVTAVDAGIFLPVTTLDGRYAALPASPAAYKLYYRDGSNNPGWTTSQASVARAMGWKIVTDPAYGATGNGSADDTAAVQAAINAAAANTGLGGRVWFPAGQYLITSTLTVTASEVKLMGSAGNGSQIIVGANVDAISFSAGLSRCGIHDLWIGSYATRTAGWGIKINGTTGSQSAYFDFSGVTVQNTYGGIYAAYLQQSTWRNTRIFATIAGGITDPGVSFIGVKSHRFESLFIVGVGRNTGTHGMLLDSDCDTILLSDVEIIGAGGDGLRGTNSLGGSSTGPRLVYGTRVLIESCTGSGVNMLAGRYFKMTQSECSVNTVDGYRLDGIDGAELVQCEAIQNGQHGFHFASGAGPYALTCCRANYNSQTTDNTYNGVQIDANVSHVAITGGGRYGNWLFSLTNGQKWGIRVEAVGTTSIIVEGNDLQGNKTAPMSWLAGSTTNRVSGNIGFNPVGAVGNPAVPASTVAFGNNFGFDCTVYVAGGTVTAIVVGGVTTGMTSGPVRVAAGQSIALTYSAAPTWVWIGD